MILAQLYQHSQRIQDKLPIEMYGKVKIHWLVELNPDGTLKGSGLKGEGFTGLGKGEFFTVPDLVRSAGVKPKLLADNGEYVFGVGRADSPTDKVAERHRQFKALVQKCAEVAQESSVEAVAKFLSDWNPKQDKEKLPETFDPAQVITFRVGSTIPADAIPEMRSVQQFWANYTAGDEEEAGSRPQMQCLVTGRDGMVEERLPVKIKGIPNGQTAGTSLVSANAAPFTSYGLSNSLTSPISREAGEGFAKALNYLISTNDSRLYIDSVVYAFWTQEPSEYDFFNDLKEDQPGEVKNFYESALKGSRIYDELNQFYALALSASGGRAVVRDWIETSIPTAISNLINWFNAQDLVDSFGEFDEQRRYLSIYRLSRCLYRDPSKEDIARITTRLMRVAIAGGTLTHEMLAQLVKRNCAERDVTRDRAALIKLILTTQLRTFEENPMADMYCLNPDPQFKDQLDRAAYHCGRLLAQLEQVQTQALGRDVNATLIDRFYGAASATPGKVLGKLVEDAQPHLARIRKDRRGTYEALQQKLEDILCNISPETGLFPNSLNSQQQSIFALGYYHQRAQNRKDAKDAAAAKKQAKVEAEIGAESNID